MPTLAELGEFPFIDRIAELAAATDESVVIGIGDDAALVESGWRTLVTTDSMVEGVHYRREWLGARDLGARAFAVSVSDIAAMGGRPRHVFASLSLPPTMDATEALDIVRGIVEEARAVGATLAGGNMTSAEQAVITLTVTGEPVEEPLRRACARPGHGVFLTGRVGEAAAGRAALEAGSRRGRLVDAWRRPPRRLAFAQALAAKGWTVAAIDISDGLVADLEHIARASGVAIRLDTSLIPLSAALKRGTDDALAAALGGGEDYELAFTAAPRHAGALRELETWLGEAGKLDDRFALHRIGTCVATDEEPGVFDQQGRRLGAGWQHFRKD